MDSKAPTSPRHKKTQATTGDGGRYACRQPGRVWAGLGLSYRKCVFDLVDIIDVQGLLRFFIGKEKERFMSHGKWL